MKDSRSCEAIREDIKAYLDGELATGRRMAVLRHFATCPSCREEADAMKQFSETLRYQEASSEGDRLDPALRARILAALPTTPPPTPRVSPLALLLRKPMLAYSTVAVVAVVAVVFRPAFLQPSRVPFANQADDSTPATANGPAAAGGSAGMAKMGGPGGENEAKRTAQGRPNSPQFEFARSPKDLAPESKTKSEMRAGKTFSPTQGGVPTVSPPASVSHPAIQLKSPSTVHMDRGLSRPQDMVQNAPAPPVEKSQTAAPNQFGAMFGKPEAALRRYPERTDTRALSASAAREPDVYLRLKDNSTVAPTMDRKGKAELAELGIIVDDLEQSGDKLTQFVKEAGGKVELIQPQTTGSSGALLNADAGGKSVFYTLTIPSAQQEKIIKQVTELSKESRSEAQESLRDQPKNVTANLQAKAASGRGGVQRNSQNSMPAGGNILGRQNNTVGQMGFGGGGGLGGGGFGSTGQGSGGRAGGPGAVPPAGPGAPAQKQAGTGGADGTVNRRSAGVENRPNKSDKVEQSDKFAEKDRATVLGTQNRHDPVPDSDYNHAGNQAVPRLDQNSARYRAELKHFQDSQAKKRGAQIQLGFSTFVVRLSEKGEKGDGIKLKEQTPTKPPATSPRNPKR